MHTEHLFYFLSAHYGSEIPIANITNNKNTIVYYNKVNSSIVRAKTARFYVFNLFI